MLRDLKYLFYKRAYRELSNDAKVMYQYLIHIHSERQCKPGGGNYTDITGPSQFVFTDEKDQSYCYVTNQEFSFVLNVSEERVRKCRLELIMVELIIEFKDFGSALNRIYLCKPVINKTDINEFKAELAKRL